MSIAKRDLRSLDPPVRNRVLDTLERLLDTEPTGDLRTLTGHSDEARASATGA